MLHLYRLLGFYGTQAAIQSLVLAIIVSRAFLPRCICFHHVEHGRMCHMLTQFVFFNQIALIRCNIINLRFSCIQFVYVYVGERARSHSSSKKPKRNTLKWHHDKHFSLHLTSIVCIYVFLSLCVFIMLSLLLHLFSYLFIHGFWSFIRFYLCSIHRLVACVQRVFFFISFQHASCVHFVFVFFCCVCDFVFNVNFSYELPCYKTIIQQCQW